MLNFSEQQLELLYNTACNKKKLGHCWKAAVQHIAATSKLGRQNLILHFLFLNFNVKEGNVLIFFDTPITISIYLPDDSFQFCTFESQRMSNLTLAAMTSRNRLDCINHCVDSVDCDSVNYLSESRMCQLGVFSESHNLSDLSYSYGWQHFSKSLCIYKYLKWPEVRFNT